MDLTQAIQLLPPQSASVTNINAALQLVRNTVTPVFKAGVTAYSKDGKYVANREAIVPHLRQFITAAGITYGFQYLGMIGVFTVTHVETGEFQRSYFELQNERKTTVKVSRKQDFEQTVTTEELDPQSPGKWNTYWQRHCLISTFTLWGTDNKDEAENVTFSDDDHAELMTPDAIRIVIEAEEESGASADEVAKQLGIHGDWKKGTLAQGRNILSVLRDMTSSPKRGRN